jgi:hypothetical protein
LVNVLTGFRQSGTDIRKAKLLEPWRAARAKLNQT